MGCTTSSPNCPYIEEWKASLKQLDRQDFNFEPSDPIILDESDFIIDHYMSEGGMGKVYAAREGKTGRKVALKIFGYTDRQPCEHDIQREIDILVHLTGVDGVVQIIGVFMDRVTGLSDVYDTKTWQRRYPVIVMECLEGGMLYDRVHRKQFMSEKILRDIFRGFAKGLLGIHKRGFLHRDLKLENVMLESYADDAAVKIIDLGMMVHLPEGSHRYIADKISGTRGYLAPESIVYKEYSAASDAWQLGCVLYTMLSGVLPFHPENMEQAARAKYYAMTGPVWEHISTDAKNLVKRLLVEKPQWRLSVEEVLQHDWLQGREVSNMDLGADYARRIKHLALREKMRNFFMRNEELLSNVRLKGDHINELLPFLKVRGRAFYDSQQVGVGDAVVHLPNVEFSLLREANRGVRGLTGLESDSTPCSSSHSEQSAAEQPAAVVVSPRSQCRMAHDLSVRTFKLRLHNIRDMVQSHDFSAGNERGIHAPLLAVEEEVTGADDRDPDQPPRLLRSFTLPPEEIDYETFVEVLIKAGLEALAVPRIFDLFDIGLKGTINLREFLLTMLAVQPTGGDKSHLTDTIPAIDTAVTTTETPAEEDSVRMFFRIFDIDNDGYINREEFALALQHLDDITPHAAPTGGEEDGHNVGSSHSVAFLENVEELFQEMDVDRSGKIDFQEFRRFYEEVIKGSQTQSQQSFF